MKINLLTSTLAALFVTTIVAAAPLTETKAVHTKPDESSPTVSYLKAGTEASASTSAMADTPAGWMAIDLPGPFEGYVLSKDLTKGLDVKPGTPIRLAPQPDGAVLAIAQRGDKTTITGLRGKWTQISLDKPMLGYVKVGGATGYAPSVATTPASSAEPSAPAGAAPAPATYGGAGAGQAAPVTPATDATNSLPRQFTGKFVSTRSVLHPRRPYDWALNDNAGRRYAYLDVSKLLLTDQIEKYVDHFVVVFGAAKPLADNKDIVIQVESLQLLLR